MYQFLFGFRLYDLVGYFNIVLTFVYNVLVLRKKKNDLLGVCAKLLIRKKSCYVNNLPNCFESKKFFSVAEIIFLTFSQGLPPFFLNAPFGRLVTDGNANYFASAFTFPFVFGLFCFLIKDDYFENLDLFTPTYSFSLIFIKLSCFFHGCCAGIETERFGLYNHEYGKVMFPVQLVEVGWAVVMFIFLQWYQKRAKKGTMYPLYLILYSSTRFCSEFLRIEPNYIGVLKKYHIFCICGLIVGIVEYIAAIKYADKLSVFLNSQNEKFYENTIKKMNKKYKKKTHSKRKRENL